jgi:hypothetical protein
MSQIQPYDETEAYHMRKLQDEGFYNLDRRSIYIIEELWRYVRYLENRIHKLEMEGQEE